MTTSDRLFHAFCFATCCTCFFLLGYFVCITERTWKAPKQNVEAEVAPAVPKLYSVLEGPDV